MAVPDWVTSIPSVPYRNLFANMQITAAHSNVMRDEMEDGPDIMTVRSQTVLQKMPWSQLITKAQYATLETFLMTTCKQGTSHFTMPINYKFGTLQTCRVFIENAEWTAQAEGLSIAVAMTLCVYPPGYAYG